MQLGFRSVLSGALLWRAALLVFSGVLLAPVGVVTGVVAATQPTVRVVSGWVKAPAAGATSTVAFATISNGTMYDVYITSVATEAAKAVELHEGSGSASKRLDEVTVPSFGQLEMTPDGAHLVLNGLTRPLKGGDTVELTVVLDDGSALTVSADVK